MLINAFLSLKIENCVILLMFIYHNIMSCSSMCYSTWEIHLVFENNFSLKYTFLCTWQMNF